MIGSGSLIMLAVLLHKTQNKSLNSQERRNEVKMKMIVAGSSMAVFSMVLIPVTASTKDEPFQDNNQVPLTFAVDKAFCIVSAVITMINFNLSWNRVATKNEQAARLPSQQTVGSGTTAVM
eukprot:TRINITY_DN12823_c0_g2_i1.p1 TRINITY_DN12823_c0_g2~~TRINITY_DN12823_c0_g2_i1.p1  ORF type:complete len:121 (-),score=22.23 TRINITY_DN12823_c0_g2_i1:138-500(-)